MPTFVTARFVKDSIDKKAWGGPIIDIGAGEYADWYKPYFNGHEYIQLDIEPAKAGTTDICADCLNMPQVKTDFYGVVLMCELLEHVSDPLAAFKEASRILKPEGLFICTTLAVWPIHRHPKDYWRFMPDGLDHLCYMANLKIYNRLFNSINGVIPGHCCVAATKG